MAGIPVLCWLRSPCTPGRGGEGEERDGWRRGEEKGDRGKGRRRGEKEGQREERDVEGRKEGGEYGIECFKKHEDCTLTYL